MVYNYVLEEKEQIQVCTYKVVGQDRRPVRQGFKYASIHPGMIWSKASGKWEGQAPSNFGVLRISKQILNESAAVAYGKNIFEFRNTSDMRIFLETIGSMRKFLTHLSLPDTCGWTFGLGRKTFDLLSDATSLRSLAIDHSMITEGPSWALSLPILIRSIRPFIKELHKAHKVDKTTGSVLNIIDVTWSKCLKCQNSRKCDNVRFGRCMKCKYAANQCRDLNAEIQAALARSLRIKR